ncbi:hypothetical protein AB6A40_007988 [Gnathostoma spinigerum]|uniref:Uncharacterized protein n=1 Tax=Gnathostoma spinigerum TaxID=75299 RepID=A0ABD6ESY4_9BILA
MMLHRLIFTIEMIDLAVLTFCTKENAIRDQNNMVIACGTEEEVWSPKRCPRDSLCFSTSDSIYRICCPVARAADYT